MSSPENGTLDLERQGPLVGPFHCATAVGHLQPDAHSLCHAEYSLTELAARKGRSQNSIIEHGSLAIQRADHGVAFHTMVSGWWLRVSVNPRGRWHFGWQGSPLAGQRGSINMILTLSIYTALATLPPAVWVCARLPDTRIMGRQVVRQSTAQVIRFPRGRTTPRQAPAL